MKKILWTLGVLAVTANVALAQDKAAIEKTLIANEHKLYEAVAKGDKAALQALVAADGVLADKNGFVPVGEFLKVFDQLKVTTWDIVNPVVLWIDQNSAIVVYVWTGAGTFMNQSLNSPVLSSTVWTKKGDNWIAVYHQETESAKK